MKNFFIKVGSRLATLVTIFFFLTLILKILEGNLFERYRNYQFLETSYLSTILAVLIGFFSVLSYRIYLYLNDIIFEFHVFLYRMKKLLSRINKFLK